eukprot:c19682_g1_i2.p1 GENE.c19682_g1_i2~~c19682_g1_i2.p1  ORF type:complete len:322 (-),score=115.12 c19682_g1_i2:32-997(-)
MIGSRISLISSSDIRYEGTLYQVNTEEATVTLQNVQAFGTEDRALNATGFPKVAPAAAIYEFIIFRASDIKDIALCDFQDPAIVGMGKSSADVPTQPTQVPPSNQSAPSQQQQPQQQQQQQLEQQQLQQKQHQNQQQSSEENISSMTGEKRGTKRKHSSTISNYLEDTSQEILAFGRGQTMTQVSQNFGIDLFTLSKLVADAIYEGIFIPWNSLEISPDDYFFIAQIIVEVGEPYTTRRILDKLIEKNELFDIWKVALILAVMQTQPSFIPANQTGKTKLEQQQNDLDEEEESQFSDRFDNLDSLFDVIDAPTKKRVNNII